MEKVKLTVSLSRHAFDMERVINKWCGLCQKWIGAEHFCFSYKIERTDSTEQQKVTLCKSCATERIADIMCDGHMAIGELFEDTAGLQHE